MTLADELRATAADLPDLSSTDAAGVTTWARGTTVFAVLGPRGVEMRLDAPIAAAAIRTPDVDASSRGREWVRFDPHELDDHALDRLHAWFELAYRRAGEQANILK